ncbi:DUF3106 domain-containing protein [Piscinibacter terrae]|uniref:DUF3106 domain-containing protein n=1 Tax=Piscinibacter terrae TaxID=2496871 RepID=A0A3N7HNB3_9BURK|nr:DUF3106 domain-containing protein [Albitalea terrae]RQP23634.1 DUF3106 domain-containing protein [Albitalea terrae]
MWRRALTPPAKLISALTLSALIAVLGAAAPSAWSQAAEAGPKWSELSASQRNSLKPLEKDWAGIDADRKEKWLEIAQRIPSMKPTERERVQARMTEWARLSPNERGQARVGFQQAKQVSPRDRQAQWEAYQALPPEQKKQLQARAVPPAPVASKANGANGQRTAEKTEKAQRKSNIVTSPAEAAPPKSIGPTVVQAQPGATTTLISKRPTPPAHQQTGIPKIAATPEFVDKRTLLPQRGPQAAATRSASASAPASSRQ